MKWSEYLGLVKEQIRDKKAKELIEDELSDHIESQMKDYEKDGLSREEAEEKAVQDMGDPIEIGTQLNEVHHPRVNQSVMILIGIFSVVTLIIQFFINQQYTSDFFINQIIYTMIGIGITIAVAHLDYTILGKIPLVLWIGLIAGSMIYITFSNERVASYTLLFDLVYWFAILFSGVLFQFRSMKLKGFLLSGVLGILPLLLTVYGKNFSAMLHYSIILLIIMNMAVGKQWFMIKKKIGFTIIWGCFGVIVGSIAFLVSTRNIPMLFSYRMVRMENIFNGASDTNYTTNLVRNVVLNHTWFGYKKEVNGIPNAKSTYVLTSIIQIFGFIAGVLVIVGLVILLHKTAQIAKQQRSVLGNMVGTACFTCLFVQIFSYIGTNFGLPGFIQMSPIQVLPFLSYGLRNAVYSYTIAGLLLSVYRNTDLVSDYRIKKISLLKRNKRISD